ncbi:MAG: hypothetical protein QM662_01660 [Gordonia sp. (in: high G+C Gram-positive bacteria)]
MRTGVPDLDDVEDLLSADSDGLLPAVALAGAQVRSVAEAVREGVAEPLAELRPRSVVVVCSAHGPAAGATALVNALVAGRVDVPVVCAPGLPGWIGPLDVVVLVGDDAGDMILADAAARSLRRRAEVVVAAPVEGPLRDALGGRGINLSPRVHVDPRFRLHGYVAVIVSVLAALTRVRFAGGAPIIGELADALDAEAAAGHPSRDTFHNQAKLLAARLDEGPVVWTGDTPATQQVALLAARLLFGIAGAVCAAADLAEVTQAWQVYRTGRPGAVEASIFYDPEIDGPPTDQPPRVLVATTAAREWYTRRRVAAIPTAEIILGDAPESADPVGAGAHWVAADPTDVPGDLGALLVLLLRVEMAAVYLRLIGAGAR